MILVILPVIDLSVSSINPTTLECLKTLLNCCKSVALKSTIVSLINVAIEVGDSFVREELNCAFISNIRKSVSGSTIIGVIEATVNGARSFTRFLFSKSVRLFPVVDLIDMKTFPYSGVLTTPSVSSKEPFSPPKIETACVFGKNLLTKVL